MLSPFQQAVDLIQKSKNILIALPENLNGDSLGSALALETALKTLGKKIEIVCAETVPEKLRFLAGSENLKNKISSGRDFIISIDTSKNKISRLRYEKDNSLLKIFLATDQKVEQRDIQLEPGPFVYDLIFTLDTQDLESLGDLYKNNAELFFNQPLLNIDCQSGNEYFGEVNLVEPTASACAEIVSRLIDSFGPNLIDSSSATALLTGLISKTHSFQNARTTPQALALASLLITRGGEQEKIVQNLYKTIPLNHLRLWGRLLSRLDFDETKKIAWLWATKEDFLATQSSDCDLPFVIEEIDDLFPQINLSFILWPEDSSSFFVLVKAKKIETVQKMNLALGGSLKNEKLLLRLTAPDEKTAKAQLVGLLNSQA